MQNSIIAAVILAALSTDPQLPAGVTCEQIKALVAEYGKVRSLTWAVRQGYSWPQIRAAKRCL